MDRSPAGTADERVRDTALDVIAEEAANLFNLRILAVLCFFAILSETLNEFGLFKVSPLVMRPAIVVIFILFFVPLGLYLWHDKWQKSPQPFIRRDFFRVLIITVTFVGIGLIGVALSMHAVILLAIPPLITAQYRDKRRLFWLTLLITALLVPVSVYGSFFFGAVDRNFIKGAMTDEEFSFFANRLTLATPKRMFELFLHYVMPRLFCVLIVSALALGVNRRNAAMLTRQAELSQKIRKEMEERNRMQGQVIETLAALIETRDESTGEHVIRTKAYVTMIANELKNDPRFRDTLTDAYIDRIENAAPLHDVGKIAVSDTILLKPGKLTPEEFDAMKVHTTKGGSMIKTLFAGMKDEAFLRTAEEIATSHHEKWNGRGYPAGLAGEAIPLSARIMAVADVYDALVSVRVYKPAMTPEAALGVMFEESGSHFDPAVMEAVDRIRQDLIDAANAPVDHRV